jgi:hypothetical protein
LGPFENQFCHYIISEYITELIQSQRTETKFVLGKQQPNPGVIKLTACLQGKTPALLSDGDRIQSRRRLKIPLILCHSHAHLAPLLPAAAWTRIVAPVSRQTSLFVTVLPATNWGVRTGRWQAAILALPYDNVLSAALCGVPATLRAYP